MPKRYILQARDSGAGSGRVVWSSDYPDDTDYPGMFAAIDLVILAEHGVADPPKRIIVSDDMIGSVSSDTFLSKIAWRRGQSTASGSLSVLPSVAGHPGIVRLTTDAAPTRNTALMPSASSTDPAFAASQVIGFRAVLRIPTISSVAVRVGFMQNLLSETGGSDGIFIEYDSAASEHWQLCIRVAGVTTRESTLVGPAASWWVDVKAEKVDGSWRMTFNDQAPVDLGPGEFGAPLTFGAYVRTHTAAERYLDVDLLEVEALDLPRFD